MLALCEIYENVKDLGVNVLHEHGWDAGAGVERIRLYLVEYARTVLDGVEIAVLEPVLNPRTGMLEERSATYEYGR